VTPRDAVLSGPDLRDRSDLRSIETAAAAACRRIAPLWPLKHFVAVNPFLGMSSQTFHATCAMLHRIGRIGMLMPRTFYRAQVHAGRISDQDLEFARVYAPQEWAVPSTLNELKAALERDAGERPKHAAHVPTVAEVLDALAGGDRVASGTAFMVDEISKWCAAYFDEGQSVWRLPGRTLRPYAAWRAAMRYDCNPEVMGVSHFRAIVEALPDDPIDTIAEVVRRQGIPERALVDYLHQALLEIGGWAAHARYLLWNAELRGATDDTLVDLLAIRIAWGYALFAQHIDDAFVAAWRRAMHHAALPPIDERLGNDPELCVDLILHDAYERADRTRPDTGGDAANAAGRILYRRALGSLSTGPRSRVPCSANSWFRRILRLSDRVRAARTTLRGRSVSRLVESGLHGLRVGTRRLSHRRTERSHAAPAAPACC
jgi:hypothetical protein